VLKLESVERVREYVMEKHNAAATMRQWVAARMGANACYSVGIQYLLSNDLSFANSTTGRTLRNSIDPDQRKLRVVWNEITMRLEKAAAATWPNRFDITIPPPPRNGGVEASALAQVKEDLLFSWMESAATPSTAATRTTSGPSAAPTGWACVRSSRPARSR
jgi:hypothetical protein